MTTASPDNQILLIANTGTQMADDEKLTEIYNTVKDLQQTIRGFNGFEGLISQVARIEEKQNNIERSLTVVEEIKNNLRSITTLIEVINARGCAFGQSSGVHVPTQPVNKLDASDESVKWREIRERLFWPILVSLIMLVIYALPKIVQILQSP